MYRPIPGPLVVSKFLSMKIPAQRQAILANACRWPQHWTC